MRKRILATGVALAALLAAAPAGAAAGSLVAAGPDGTAQFAWTAGGAAGMIEERPMAADGTLGETQFVSAAHRQALGQVIGADSEGNAVIAWLAVEDGALAVRARRRTPDGGLSASQRLSPAGAHVLAMDLDVSPAGEAIAIWTRVLGGRTVIQARRRAAGGTLGAVQTLSYAGASSTSPSVAIAPDGTAAAIWLREVPLAAGTGYVVQLRTIAPGDALGATETLTRAADGAGGPRVAILAGGAAIVGWTRNLGPVQYRILSPEGVLGAPVTLASSGHSDSLALAGNGTGRVAFAWAEPDGNGTVVRARIRQAGGGLGPAFDLGSGREQPRTTAALDPQGNATFAWLDPSGGAPAVQARRRTTAGSLGPVRTLTDTDGAAGAPDLAVDGGGKATVAWRRAGEGEHLARTITPGGTVSPIRQISGG